MTFEEIDRLVAGSRDYLLIRLDRSPNDLTAEISVPWREAVQKAHQKTLDKFGHDCSEWVRPQQGSAFDNSLLSYLVAIPTSIVDFADLYCALRDSWCDIHPQIAISAKFVETAQDVVNGMLTNSRSHLFRRDQDYDFADDDCNDDMSWSFRCALQR